MLKASPIVHVVRAMERASTGQLRQLTILGDGAAWIWGIASSKFLSLASPPGRPGCLTPPGQLLTR